MTNVGIRDFRSDLRRWLNKVAKGGEVIITDRGHPIAKLSSPDGRDHLAELVAAGLVIPPSKPKVDIRKIKKIRTRASVSDALLEDREQGY